MSDDPHGTSEQEASALALHELSNLLLAIQLTAEQALKRPGSDSVLTRQLRDILGAAEQGTAVVTELANRAAGER